MTTLQSRNGVIDACRGIAVLSVIAYHYLVRWAPPLHTADLYGYDSVFASAFEAGKLGVHLFFVISGLVITMTVLRSSSPIEFAVRRVARLFPALAVASLITLLLVGSFGPAELRRTPADWLASLTFAPGYLGQQAVDGSYWSLWVEVRFYAWVALSVLLLGQRFWVGIVAVALAAVPLQLLAKAGGELLFPEYMPLFLLGMATWYMLFEKDWIAGAVTGLLGLALYLLRAVDYGQMAGGFEPLAPAGLLSAIGLMMFSLMQAAPHWIAPLSAVGRWSYSLYLLHQYLGVTLIGRLTAAGAPDLIAICVTIAAMIWAAAMLYRLVELPGQRLVMAVWRTVRRADV